MSALSFQINSSTLHGSQGIAAVASRHHHVTRLLAHAMSLVERDQKAAMEFVRQASALAYDTGRLEQTGIAMRGGLAPWQAERVRRHIEKNYAGRISVEELARLARLSNSYFSAAFRATFGTSPHDYVCRRRVQQVMYMMINTESPLAEIALDCGFADQSHLSRVFRRITKHTPAAWRRVARVA